MNIEIDTHSHTLASGHAYNTIREMAASAAKKGQKGLAITDHSIRMPGTCHIYYFQNLRVVPRRQCGIELLLGTELNILNEAGEVDLAQEVLQEMDIAIASIHLPCYKGEYSKEMITRAYVNAMQNEYVDIIGHPDDGRFPVDYETLVCGARENHVLLEVNSSSLHPACHRQNARENYIRILELCRQYQVPVILDSDAHCEADVGNHARALALLKELDFPEELVVNSSLERAAEYIPCLKSILEAGGLQP